MWVIRFRSEFIAETTFQLYSHCHDNANLLLKTVTVLPGLFLCKRMMNDEMLEPAPDYAVIRQLLARCSP